ncbi:MAG: response regulator [Gammaproteobacteria bacterium]
MDVLYIEDNAANGRLLSKYFALRGSWQLTLAASAEEGIAQAVREPPALILMDLNLPGKSGDEALRELRADPATAGIPVVAISADARPEHVAAMLAAGFEAYVTKPVDFDELERLLVRYAP